MGVPLCAALNAAAGRVGATPKQNGDPLSEIAASRDN